MEPNKDSERILEIIRLKNLTNTEFCSKTGISPATLSQISKGHTKPSLTTMRNVVAAFPEFNPLWVTYGDGDMYVGGAAPVGSGESASQSVDNPVMADQKSDPSADLHVVAPADELFGGPDVFDFPKGTPTPTSAQREGRQPRPASLSPQSQAVTSKVSVSEIVRETLAQTQQSKRHQRQIIEIRIFFDDGTYESFGGPK